MLLGYDKSQHMPARSATRGLVFIESGKKPLYVDTSKNSGIVKNGKAASDQLRACHLPLGPKAAGQNSQGTAAASRPAA
jgi:hypothetical protein